MVSEACAVVLGDRSRCLCLAMHTAVLGTIVLPALAATSTLNICSYFAFAMYNIHAQAVNELISGFAGGTVGVMGTLIALELKKQNVISRSDCPYCQGAGKLPCAQCYGSGVMLVKTAGAADDPALRMSVPCSCCKGTALITCVICRGDGQAVPVLLEQKGAPARGVKGVNSLEPDDDFDYDEEQAPVYADAQRR